MASPILNIAAYKFVTLDELPKRRTQLRAACESRGLRGTILLAGEGINMFLAGDEEQLNAFLAEVREDPILEDLVIKRSYSEKQPFRRMLVRLKQEIIAFGVKQVDPREATSPKLRPEELKQWLDEGQRVHLLDVRNDYEVEVGTFHDAVPIGVDHFRDFPAAVSELPSQWRDEPVVMFCTGGIRCEKAGPFMEQQGFRKIYQLDGGILNYFEQCGGEHYDGDCFVFDHRVAVDPALAETPLKMCFACQAVLDLEQQRSEHYVPGVSCPSCYRSHEEEQRTLLAQRRQQIVEATTPLPGSQPYDSIRPLRIPEKVDGQLLIDALDDLFPFVGRERWKASCEAGRVIEDGRPLTMNDQVRAGQQLQHIEPNVVEPDVNAEIQVLYEDDDLIAVLKPAPLPMHPCGRFNHNTLVSILNRVYAPEKVRCAHRLDANTSGLVVMTKRRAAASVLQPQFERGEVEKTYLALVHGSSDNMRSLSFSCEAPIGSQVGPVGLRTTAGPNEPSQSATTKFQILRPIIGSSEGQQTLLQVQPLTGRTNQIRIHCWHLGHPIVGDPAYLPDRQLGDTQTTEATADPMCLHAWKIKFRHPTTGEMMQLEAPEPGWAE